MCYNLIFSLQTICFNALHLQSIQRRLKEMRVKMANDLHKRLVSIGSTNNDLVVCTLIYYYYA